jgi:hypothetical protein
MIPGFGRSEVVIIYPEIYTYILMYIDHAKSNPTIPSNPHVSPLRVLEASPGLAGRQSWFGRSKVFSLLGKWTSPILMGYYIKYVGILYMKNIYIYRWNINIKWHIKLHIHGIWMEYWYNIGVSQIGRGFHWDHPKLSRKKGLPTLENRPNHLNSGLKVSGH